MADQDETDDALDSLTWPDTSRPIISNNLPSPARPPAHRQPFRPRPVWTGPRRRRWPLLVAGVVVAAALAVLLVILLG